MATKKTTTKSTRKPTPKRNSGQLKKKEAAKKTKAVSKTKSSPKLKPKKQTLVDKYQTHKSDTGSTSVQVALLTDRISELVKHLRKHPKDFDSKRGLLMQVGKRRRLLNYLNKTNSKQYEKVIADLKLRK